MWQPIYFWQRCQDNSAGNKWPSVIAFQGSQNLHVKTSNSGDNDHGFPSQFHTHTAVNFNWLTDLRTNVKTTQLVKLNPAHCPCIRHHETQIVKEKNWQISFLGITVFLWSAFIRRKGGERTEQNYARGTELIKDLLLSRVWNPVVLQEGNELILQTGHGLHSTSPEQG